MDNEVMSSLEKSIINFKNIKLVESYQTTHCENYCPGSPSLPPLPQAHEEHHLIYMLPKAWN